MQNIAVLPIHSLGELGLIPDSFHSRWIFKDILGFVGFSKAATTPVPESWLCQTSMAADKWREERGREKRLSEVGLRGKLSSDQRGSSEQPENKPKAQQQGRGSTVTWEIELKGVVVRIQT